MAALARILRVRVARGALVWLLWSSSPWVAPPATALAGGADAPGVATPDAAAPVSASGAAPGGRVEAHSADLLAVGVVTADRMAIHLSRRLDNAPVHDAAVNVVLRGITYPTLAQADGSFLLNAPDLTLQGAAAVEFQVVRPTGSESLQGTLQSGAGAVPVPEEARNGSRQLWWWALNFGVCIGFLWLWSRRKKPDEDDP